MNDKALNLVRAVPRGRSVGGDRSAESLFVIFRGDPVLKKPGCTNSGEEESVQELVIFAWYRACPEVQPWNNRFSEAAAVDRGIEPDAHTFSVLALSRGF